MMPGMTGFQLAGLLKDHPVHISHPDPRSEVERDLRRRSAGVTVEGRGMRSKGKECAGPVGGGDSAAATGERLERTNQRGESSVTGCR